MFCFEQSCCESCCLREVLSPGFEEKASGKKSHLIWIIRDMWGLLRKVRAIGMENRRTLQMGASACAWSGSERELDLCNLQSSECVCTDVYMCIR